MLRVVLAVLAVTTWIGLSEFARNELMFKSLWVDHYASLGLTFPSDLVNNAFWGLWSLVFAGLIVFLVRRLKPLEAFLFAWTAGFVLMWLVIGNLGVLPLGLLIWAVPLSLLEAGVAVLIAKGVTKSWN